MRRTGMLFEPWRSPSDCRAARTMSAHRSQASGLYGVLRPKKRTGSRVGPLLNTSVDSQGAGPMPTEIGAGDLSDSAVRAQLDSILASAVFSRSPHLRRFLSFIVEQTLAGQGPRLKEAVLAHELYGKGTNFDAGNDPVVRVDARRLRDKLREFYEGRSDPIVIALPKGSYVPVFEARSPS